MISPLIKWNHTDDWFTPFYRARIDLKDGCRRVVFRNKEAEMSFIRGHTIDGRNLFPATGYIHMVWETFANMCGMLISAMKVVFEDVKFHRATTVSEEKNEFTVMIQRCGGRFEVVESETAIVTGRVRLTDEGVNIPAMEDEGDTCFPLDENDIYKELRLRGYNYR